MPGKRSILVVDYDPSWPKIFAALRAPIQRALEGREAFESPDGPAHHLYVCVQGSPALANHLAIRDCLRRNPAKALEYGALKKQLAKQFPTDAESYIAAKTDFLMDILQRK